MTAATFVCPRGHKHYGGAAFCTVCGAGPVLAAQAHAVADGQAAIALADKLLKRNDPEDCTCDVCSLRRAVHALAAPGSPTLREALEAVLDCKGSYEGTVSQLGGYPAICSACQELARAALAASGSPTPDGQEASERDERLSAKVIPGSWGSPGESGWAWMIYKGDGYTPGDLMGGAGTLPTLAAALRDAADRADQIAGTAAPGSPTRELASVPVPPQYEAMDRYAARSLEWKNGDGKTEDELLQRIWNLAGDVRRLVRASGSPTLREALRDAKWWLNNNNAVMAARIIDRALAAAGGGSAE